ncbi:hypothetical protein IG631_12204 [Alternaria alternata]|nr:hypothetical protein IG631_12204 [Alternaria alternata]
MQRIYIPRLPRSFTPHTSSPHQARSSNACGQPLCSPCFSSEVSPGPESTTILRSRTSRSIPNSNDPSTHKSSRCLPKFPTSSSSSRSAGARMPAVRLPILLGGGCGRSRKRNCAQEAGDAESCDNRGRECDERSGLTVLQPPA